MSTIDDKELFDIYGYHTNFHDFVINNISVTKDETSAMVVRMRFSYLDKVLGGARDKYKTTGEIIFSDVVSLDISMELKEIYSLDQIEEEGMLKVTIEDNSYAGNTHVIKCKYCKVSVRDCEDVG